MDDRERNCTDPTHEHTLDRVIANTAETIAVCEEGLALDANRDYYEPEKRALVLRVLRDARARLAGLQALAERRKVTHRYIEGALTNPRTD